MTSNTLSLRVVPAVNYSDATDFVVMATLQHLGHGLRSDCPVQCSCSLCIVFIQFDHHQGTQVSICCVLVFYMIKLTCADCEKLREGSKVWSHRGGCRVYLPSPEVVQHLNDVLQRSTSFFYGNYLAGLHDAEIGFRD